MARKLDTDIPVKVFLKNAEFFAEQICRQFNESKFPATFKFANVTSVFKLGIRNLKDYKFCFSHFIDTLKFETRST